MSNSVRIDSSIKPTNEKDHFEGEITFILDNLDKVKVNYLCNSVGEDLKNGVLDFKFVENGKEFFLKGKITEFYDKLSDRQKLLYFCLFGIILELIRDFRLISNAGVLKQLDLSNGIQRTGNMPLSQFHVDTIFRKNLN